MERRGKERIKGNEYEGGGVKKKEKWDMRKKRLLCA